MIAGVIATFGGVGRIPFAPGTWGSLATLPFAWLVHYLTGGIGIVVVTVVLIFAGYWATKTYLNGRQDDPKEVVIDEVVGQRIGGGLRMSKNRNRMNAPTQPGHGKMCDAVPAIVSPIERGHSAIN